LTDTLIIKRVVPVDVIREGESSSGQNEDERFDADFTLMTGEISHLMTDLVEALGGLEASDRA
jgi:recombination associated protein RdgC